MRPDILILGQGLAGTWLAWEFERAGIAFQIADGGHETAASRVAAGIINPITGRRLVKSWRVEGWLPAARLAYRELEDALGVSLWREMRVRRFFADEREGRVAREKQAKGELSPYVVGEVAAEDNGMWIEGAARVDLPGLLAAARARWRAQGRLCEDALNGVVEAGKWELVVDCTGASGARSGGFDFVPWAFSKGEVLAIKVAGLAPEVVLNGGHWVLPVGEGKAWVGATHAPEFADLAPTNEARVALRASAEKLLANGRGFEVSEHFAGVRVNLPDKRPVVGRHPQSGRRGVLNGLGAKGALWAPMLARQWVNHLTEGVGFDAEVDVARFWR